LSDSWSKRGENEACKRIHRQEPVDANISCDHNSFLDDPAIDATNWRPEHAIRPAVVTRKVCGGNRTARGAETRQMLASVLRTLDQRGLEPADVFTPLLQAPQAIVAPALQTPPA
jgi:hypothetical protein